jgi:hypothetical protein
VTDGDSSAERPGDPEVAWLLARERGLAAAAPSGELERAHDRLAAALAALPAVPSDPGWQDRILAHIDGPPSGSVVPLRPRRPRLRWVAVAAPALAAAAAVALWLGRDPRRADPELLSVTVRAGEAPRRGGDPATVGDVLEASAPAGAELRIYRGDHALIVRCPGDAACASSGDGGARVAWPLTAPGRYRAVALSGPAASTVPRSGDLDADLAAAARAGVRVTAGPAIDVD